MAFNVVVQPGGKTFSVEPGASILAAALQAGISLPYSCRMGVCGTCIGKVLEGQVDHAKSSPAYLDEDARRAGHAMLCQAIPRSDLVIEAQELKWLEGVKPRPMPGRVAGLERAAPDVMVVRVRLPMNENLLFAAGQYMDLMLAQGERRSYSMATTPTAEGVTELELHIRHLPGGLFTDHVFSAMKPRELLKLEGPFGSFFIREDSSLPIIFLASGTGFAPVKAMLTHAFKMGVHEKREMHLYWGGRTRKCLYMADLATQWAQQYEGFNFVPVVSNATAQCEWDGRSGYVHEAVLKDFGDLSGFQVYACGSPLVINAAHRDFVSKRGLLEENFFSDEFLTAADRAAAAVDQDQDRRP